MRLVLLTLCALLTLLAPPVLAEPRVPIRALATIVAVPDAQHVVVDRGAVHGLTLSEPALIHPLRLTGKVGQYDPGNILAWCIQPRIEPRQTQWTVLGAAVPLMVGDVMAWTCPVPAEIAQDPLVQLLALGLQPLDVESKQPLVHLAELMQTPTPAEVARQVAVLTRSAVQAAPLARQFFATMQVRGGRLGGLMLGDAFERTTDADTRAFLAYAAANHEGYAGRTFLWVDVYATWLIGGCPDGAAARQAQQVAELEAEANDAAAQVRWERADRVWRQVQTLDPTNAHARPARQKLARRANLASRLQEDPQDQEVRTSLAVLLTDLGALTAADEHWRAVQAQGDAGPAVARRRALLAEKAGRWSEATRQWHAIARETREARDARAARRTEAVQHALALPTDPTAVLLAAELLEEAEQDAAALPFYRQCRQLTHQVPQRNRAWSGEQRLVGHLAETSYVEACEAAIQRHDDKLAREHLGKLQAMLKESHRDLIGVLARLLQAAMAVQAFELAHELCERMLAVDPQNLDAQLTLGTVAMMRQQTETALTYVQKAARLDPQNAYVYWLQLRLLLALGRTDEARAASERALQVDGRSFDALMSSARVAVAEGRYQEAVLRMQRAWSRAHTRYFASAGLPDRGYVEVAAEAAQGLKARPTDATARLRLLQALVELDLLPQATEQWQRLPVGSVQRRQGAAALGGNRFVPAHQAVPWLEQAQDGTLALKQLLDLARARAENDAHPQDPRALLQLARALVLDGEFHAARDAVARARDLPGLSAALLTALTEADAAAETGVRAEADLERAETADESEQEEDAQAPAAAALQGFLAIGALDRAITAAVRVASLANSLAQDDLALASARQCVAIAERLGDPLRIATAREVLAQVRMRQGDLAAWPPALQAIGQVCRDLGRLGCQADIAVRQARLAAQEGKLADALTAARLGRKLAERGGNLALMRKAMVEEAQALRDSVQLPEATTVATELLRASREGGDGDRERTALLLLVNLAWQQGDARATEQRLAEATALAEQTGNRWMEAALRQERGEWLLFGRGEAKAALPWLEGLAERYRKLSQRTNQWQAEVLYARALLAAGLPDQATAVAARVEPKLRELGLPVPAVHAARVLALAGSRAADPRTREVAVQAGLRALQGAQALDQPGLLPLAHHACAMALLRHGDQDKGLHELDEAVQAAVHAAVAGTARTVGTGRRQESDQVWADAVAARLEAGQVDKGQQLSDLWRAVQARQTRTLTGLAGGDPKADAILRKYVASQQQRQAALDVAQGLAKGSAREREAWRHRAQNSEQQADQLLDTMRREHRKLWTQVAVEPESLTALLPHLPAKALIVQYFATADRLYAFVVGGGRPGTRVVQVQVPWKQVETAVAGWRRAVVGRGDLAVATRGAEALGDDPPEEPVGDETERRWSEPLYRWLLDPLQAELKQASVVLVVPFGALHYLPLHALARWDEQGRPRYALEDWRIGYLTGTTATALSDRPRPAHQGLRVLGMGNPDGTLPGAREELERARRFLPAGSQLWFGPDATGKRFLSLAPDFDVLHIATHGVLRPDPADSHLRMADGPLTLATISGAAGLDQRPRLVVLSACSTALERGKTPGDEIASLSTAFAVAGVPALLATLWDVDDAATAELIAAFYETLTGPKHVDTLEALRQAQLHVLAAGRKGHPQWQSPAAWAAMHLVGDPR